MLTQLNQSMSLYLAMGVWGEKAENAHARVHRHLNSIADTHGVAMYIFKAVHRSCYNTRAHVSISNQFNIRRHLCARHSAAILKFNYR